jgi:hypothetical protein
VLWAFAVVLSPGSFTTPTTLPKRRLADNRWESTKLPSNMLIFCRTLRHPLNVFARAAHKKVQETYKAAHKKVVSNFSKERMGQSIS